MDCPGKAQWTLVMTQLSKLLSKDYVPFLAALLLLFGGTAWPCPPGCHVCTVDRVQCEHISSLREVLGGLSSNTERILVLYGNLTEIPPLSFAEFPRLHFLSITGSPLSSLCDLAFFSMHFNSLRVLNLSDNSLLSCMIEPMAFAGLPFLRELILANNSLDIVRQLWFLEMPGLLRLHLGANQIAYLPPRTFQNLTKLSELVVSFNLIQYLPMDTFYGMPLLTRLDLSNNRILFINHEVFQPLQALKHLLLFRNRLTVLPIFPSSISFLFLHENPWLCTCQLVSSMEPFLEKIQSPDGVTCDGPPSLAGHQVAGTRPEGCSSRSSAEASSSSLLSSSSSSSLSTVTSTHVAPSVFWNLSFLYGFLGGILTSIATCLLCCCCCFWHFRQHWNFAHFARKTESKKTHQGKTAQSLSSETRPSGPKPRVLCSFPVVQNTAVGSDVVCATRRASSGCQEEPMGCTYSKPLVAVLSTDAAGQRVVTLHEDGEEAGCPVSDPSHCQTHEENIDTEHEATPCEQTADEAAAHMNCYSSEQQNSTKRKHGSGDLDLQHAASSPVESQHCEKSADGQASQHEIQPRSLQCPQVLVNINVPDGGAQKTEGPRDWAYETSFKRTESQQSGFHFHPSRRWSPIRKSSSSLWRPSHHHLACFVPPRTKKTCHVKVWQKGSVRRRHSRHMARSAHSTWKSDLYADISLLASEVNMRQERTSRHRCCFHPTSATASTSSISSTSSLTEENGLFYPKKPYVETLFVPHYPGTREMSSQPPDDVSQAGKIHPEHQKIRSWQHNAAVTSTRSSCVTERGCKCPRCDCDNPSAQRTWPQWDTAPGTSKGLLDVVNQPSSTDTINLEEREMALACLGPHENAEKSSSQELWRSMALPDLPLPVSRPERLENDVKSAYEEVSLPTASPRPLAEESSSQLPLESEDERMEASSPREASLGDEIPDTEESLDSNSLGQHPLDGRKAPLPSEYSNVALSEPCYSSSKGHLFRIEAHLSKQETYISNKSCRGTPDSDPQGDGYEELNTTTATTTSWCPEVQKMRQIVFPLLTEEKKPREHIRKIKHWLES